MKVFHVRGIVWDTDGKRPVLPGGATVDAGAKRTSPMCSAMRTAAW